MINTLISVNENDNEDVTNHTEEEDSDAKIIKTSIVKIMTMKMNMMHRLSKVKMITIMKMSQTTQRRKIPVGRTETTPCPVLALKHHHLLLISLYKVLSVLSWL